MTAGKLGYRSSRQLAKKKVSVGLMINGAIIPFRSTKAEKRKLVAKKQRSSKFLASHRKNVSERQYT